MILWTNIDYLQLGSSIQAEVYRLIVHHRLLCSLEAYRPVLVGTIPIEINVTGSDLDIICEVYDFDRFESDLRKLFSKYSGFIVKKSASHDDVFITVNFECEGWPVEIYGQSMPTAEQNGFKHMVVEDRMLRLFGTAFREHIVAMKSYGIKTEPAFAKALKLEGDPYRTLLEMYHWSDESLLSLWKDRTNHDYLD